jgi:hypothetical protein
VVGVVEEHLRPPAAITSLEDASYGRDAPTGNLADHWVCLLSHPGVWRQGRELAVAFLMAMRRHVPLTST